MATCQDCGNDVDTCSDPNIAWYPQRTICYATMARRSAERRYEELHKDRPYHDGTYEHWAKEADKYHPFHADDGSTIWVSEHDLTPDDHFLGEPNEISAETLKDPVSQGGASSPLAANG